MEPKILYTPLLRPKQGEVFALRDLEDSVKDSVRPLFDLIPVPKKSSDPKKALPTLAEHLVKQIVSLANNWPSRDLIVDFSSISLDQRVQGKHYVEWACEQMRSRDFRFSVATGLDRDEAYQQAVRRSLENSDVETVCIRVLKEDLTLSAEDLATQLIFLVRSLAIAPSDAILLFDMKQVSEDDAEETLELLSTLLPELALEDWREVVFAGSNFPMDMTGIPPDTEKRIPRTELSIWEGLRLIAPLLGATVGYGDYCVSHPEKPELEAKVVKAGGKIRYTSGREWIVVRGHGLHKGERYQQYHSLSQKVYELEEFVGDACCWGDRYINLCRSRAVSTGNLTTWVRVDTNHHITFVVKQLQQRFVA